MFAFQFSSTDGKTKTGALNYVYHNISDLLSNGYGGNTYSIGSGVYVIILGLIVAIIGVFWDVVKLFKKDLGVDSKYLSNSLNTEYYAEDVLLQRILYYVPPSIYHDSIILLLANVRMSLCVHIICIS